MNYRRTIGREGGGTAGQTEKTWVGGAPEKPNLFLLGDYIKPYTLTTFANVNHFVVGYAGADGKPIALRLASGCRSYWIWIYDRDHFVSSSHEAGLDQTNKKPQGQIALGAFLKRLVQ
ncbi:hypothetical protein [Pseudomonas thivervalensis]|uniref:hypothetical protein n=1 Tax=Pseudomonas thivervalensis TaxID=86265 RepID=UPI003D9855B8